MAVTLVEAAKRNSGDVVRSSVIELFARNSDILRVMMFSDIAGNALKYNQETTLPGIGFRGVNEGFAESTGVLNPQTESLVIGGGDLDVDKFIVDTQGPDQRATQEAMKAKALAQNIGHKMIKGDSDTDPKEFDGLQKRLVIGGSQVIENGATDGGDALSLGKLDELIDAVDSPNYLLMSKAMRRIITAASRNESVGGHVNYTQDEFGRTQTVYNDLPILIADGNGDLFQSLAFDEVGAGGSTATATSIYCLQIEEGILEGIQNGVMDVRDLGELETKPTLRTRVEWYVGMALQHPRGAARLRGISNAAAVV